MRQNHGGGGGSIFERFMGVITRLFFPAVAIILFRISGQLGKEIRTCGSKNKTSPFFHKIQQQSFTCRSIYFLNKMAIVENLAKLSKLCGRIFSFLATLLA
jgi:hypothetical protein